MSGRGISYSVAELIFQDSYTLYFAVSPLNLGHIRRQFLGIGICELDPVKSHFSGTALQLSSFSPCGLWLKQFCSCPTNLSTLCSRIPKSFNKQVAENQHDRIFLMKFTNLKTSGVIGNMNSFTR